MDSLLNIVPGIIKEETIKSGLIERDEEIIGSYLDSALQDLPKFYKTDIILSESVCKHWQEWDQLTGMKIEHIQTELILLKLVGDTLGKNVAEIGKINEARRKEILINNK